MPTYYFDLWDGQRIDFDEMGLDLSGPEAAFEEAILGARDMLRETHCKGRDASGWAYQVRDEAGKALFTVPFTLAADLLDTRVR